MTADQPTPRSRKLYVLWAIALTLLLTGGAFCWAVVVPVWRVHRVLRACVRDELSPEEAVEQLGGPHRAANGLNLCLRLPRVNVDSRREATRVLRECGPEAVPVLTRLLADSDKYVRNYAALELGEIGPEARRSVPALSAALSDEDWSVRHEAAEALGEIGPDSRVAVRELSKLLSDSDARMRLTVAQALGKIGPDARLAVPALIALLTDADWRVGRVAAEALGQIGPDAREAIPALIRLITETGYGGVRNDAAGALGRIGPDAREAIPELTQLLSDPSWGVRETAREALKKIKAAQEKKQ